MLIYFLSLKHPYFTGVVATVTIAFIMVGDINFLAPIVTMPFLLTYACIDYSYFALAQTFDIQTKREERFRIQAQSPSYESRRYGAVEQDNDLDHLFPERTRHKLGVSFYFKLFQKLKIFRLLTEISCLNHLEYIKCSIKSQSAFNKSTSSK